MVGRILFQHGNKSLAEVDRHHDFFQAALPAPILVDAVDGAFLCCTLPLSAGDSGSVELVHRPCPVRRLCGLFVAYVLEYRLLSKFGYSCALLSFAFCEMKRGLVYCHFFALVLVPVFTRARV